MELSSTSRPSLEEGQGWIEMLLLAAGKEVFIEVVAQAISTYSMSCFRLLRGLCHHTSCLFRNFWWGSKDGQRKTCWVSWKGRMKPKYLGGLGLRDFFRNTAHTLL
jgi:hypothetical protein